MVANSSEKVLQIPGRVGGRQVAVHPTPGEFVAVVWKSPLAGNVSVASAYWQRPSKLLATRSPGGWSIARRPRPCWWAKAALDLGGEVKIPTKQLKVEKGGPGGAGG